jgi:hypothetical protein
MHMCVANVCVNVCVCVCSPNVRPKALSEHSVHLVDDDVRHLEAAGIGVDYESGKWGGVAFIVMRV